MSDSDVFKRQAAERAMTFVRPGMRLGLGTGSTAKHFVDLLGEAVRRGLDVVGAPTSEATAHQAAALGVPLTTLDETPELDLAVDGADEIDSSLRLIKGGGGALLREKIVAAASRRMLVIADSSKFVAELGAFSLPVEVVPFGLGATRRRIERASAALGLAGTIALRERKGQVFVTDGGHYILDCAFGAIPDPEALANVLAFTPGVVDHGLFLGMANAAVLAGPQGVTVLGAVD
ncbi:MAG TPA: ribose-5-phosphate isomerase RpiA [Roseiarcus sp.]|jgi:ribose 5-phosphate isomerase A